MKKQSVFKDNENKNSKQRLFYLAMGVSIIAIALAIYVGVNSTIDQLNSNDLDGALSDSSTADVSANEDDIPIESDEADVSSDESFVSSDVEEILPESEDSIDTDTDTDTQVSIDSSQASDSSESSSDDDIATSTSSEQLFMMPLDGDILNEFSNSELVKSKTLNEWRTHDGVDISSPANTPVKAICDGVIESIEEDPMWGVCVVITHDNGYSSYYYGLKTNVSVKVGADVLIGDVIGYVGNTAEIEIAEDSHLHLGLKLDDVWIDPLSVM